MVQSRMGQIHQTPRDENCFAPETLAAETTVARASGKAILLGEHSVVYGMPALAVALPGLSLQLKVLKPLVENFGTPSLGTQSYTESCPLSKWYDSWKLSVAGTLRNLDLKQRKLLTQCLDMALRESALGRGLADFKAQALHIDSQFPMGAGLGGSAALCVAAVKLADSIAAEKLGVSLEQASGPLLDRLGRAHRLDNIFHGTASGVDTATVLSNGLIECAAGRRITQVSNKKSFYLALVDSCARSETAAMVLKVRELKRCQPVYVDEKMQRLGEIARSARSSLEYGYLEALGIGMNEAHEHLRDLGLSTVQIERIRSELLDLGALGAKLTGSGGGGFVMGLFREYPHWVLEHLPVKGAVYVSEVPAAQAESRNTAASPQEILQRDSAKTQGGSSFH